MDRNQLKEIVLEQKETFEKPLDIVPRTISKNAISSPKITVITGIRRCGKSTLLRQFAMSLKDYSYINFEDERLLEFTHTDFNVLLEVFLELNPHTKTFFFDEIQNIVGWEKFCRRLFTEGYKLFVTGSSANLLSSEIATSLTGRNIQVELYPFSFHEFLKYNKILIKEIHTTKERAQIAKLLEEYLSFGGFPEVIKSKDYEELNQIYQDIIIKDLLVRLQIRDTKDFRELAFYLLSNTSKKISYNNLKNLLQFSNTSKVKNYVEALVEAYLFFTINKYDPSIKKQIRNEKKVYCIDQGIIQATAFKFSRDEGRIIENVVFAELKRRKNELFYEEEKTECDFLIKEGLNINQAIQVTVSLADEKTKQREITGVLNAMNKYNLKEGLIITKNHEEIIAVENKKIIVKPLWKFLLNL
jgi:predicted AAA+ superfamily ATPase